MYKRLYIEHGKDSQQVTGKSYGQCCSHAVKRPVFTLLKSTAEAGIYSEVAS
jgi:hypothetical protein